MNDFIDELLLVNSDGLEAHSVEANYKRLVLEDPAVFGHLQTFENGDPPVLRIWYSLCNAAKLLMQGDMGPSGGSKAPTLTGTATASPDPT